ncbi:MAG TPA: hypothetical protein DCZ94_07815 [Lentisphaeria bacterium]|nr:MAG: hypothetical protein A2X48_24215 [Lentisphaerae bacterium GWF2_49_21]HBC86843.1 hypothetical protein [Lentisphaeria bacterium]
MKHTALIAIVIGSFLFGGCQKPAQDTKAVQTETSPAPVQKSEFKITEDATAIAVQASSYSAKFAKDNGSIISISRADGTPLLKGGDEGLWRAVFLDKHVLEAAKFSPAAPDMRSSFRIVDAKSIDYSFESDEIKVSATITPATDGLYFKASLTTKKSDLIEFALPGAMQFQTDDLKELICQVKNPRNVGMALNQEFFRDHSADPVPFMFEIGKKGPEGYLELMGNSPLNLGNEDKESQVTITETGREWLGDAVAEKVSKVPVIATRPFEKGHADIVIAETTDGVYFGGARPSAASKGHLFRVGGRVQEKQVDSTLAMVGAAIDRVTADGVRNGRNGIAIINFPNGPVRWSFTNVTAKQWEDRLNLIPDVKNGTAEIISISTIDELEKALANPRISSILNPYGEIIPVRTTGSMSQLLKSIRAYIDNGGNWFETGGYSFYQELVPSRFYSLPSDGKVPGIFADFLHFDFQKESHLSIYSIQPITWKAWEAERDLSKMFVQSKVNVGANENGGYFTRPFSPYVKAGETWQSPVVHMKFGGNAIDGAKSFCADNRIEKKLSDKLSPEKLRKFKECVVYKYEVPSAKECLDLLQILPSPSIVHSASYLKGGFDKEYPDQLPPRASFATPEEFRALTDKIHSTGSLFMPYTNNTWWCDNPKGPTFLKHGNEPLLIGLNGKYNHEIYGKNDGWTTTMWHPAVRQINMEVIRQFTEEYGADIIFQDQCGARDWMYDLNPAAPNPSAYMEAIVSSVRTDSSVVPLSTEDAWWGILDSEIQICGLSFGYIPEHKQRPLKNIFPAKSWRIFPIALAMAHDKVGMTHHNLGQSVDTPKELALTLAFGYSMINRVSKNKLAKPEYLEWLRWIDRIQKSVASEYMGTELKTFKHRWGDIKNPEDDGLITARYGDTSIISNLSPVHIKIAGFELAPYGFFVSSPKVEAGALATAGGQIFDGSGMGYILEKHGETSATAWVFALPGTTAIIPGMSSMKTASTDNGAALETKSLGKDLSISLPKIDNIAYRKLWKIELK